MIAIIKTGSKQYKVQEGDTLAIERMDLGNQKSLKLDQVLLLADKASVQVGRPLVKGAYCEAEVLGEFKAKKVISFKYIRREKSATKVGHRQKYLRVKIKSIKGA